MKLSKLLALLMAVAMIFSIAACSDPASDPTPPEDNTPANNEGNNESNGENGDENGEEVPIPESDEFDFLAIAFNNRAFEVPAGGDIKVGGNMNGEGGGAEDGIKILGFQGYTKPDDGYPVDDDPDGEWLTLVSQNGEFWANIARIEADFFLEGLNGFESEEISNVETFFQGGGLASWNFLNSGENLLWEFDEENGGDGFKWGLVMKAVWDVGKFKEELTEEQQESFGQAATLVDPDDESSDKKGGGVNKFGLMIKTDNVLEDVTAKISWTDVKIYVHDLELFNSFIEELEEITGKSMSANTEGRVIQA